MLRVARSYVEMRATIRATGSVAVDTLSTDAMDVLLAEFRTRLPRRR